MKRRLDLNENRRQILARLETLAGGGFHVRDVDTTHANVLRGGQAGELARAVDLVLRNGTSPRHDARVPAPDRI